MYKTLLANIDKEIFDPYCYNSVKTLSSCHKYNYTSAMASYSKNRYYNVLACDKYRFKSKIIDYINASCVETKYILTQGPLVSTIIDFWTMVIESKSNVIVCLSKHIENSSVKYDMYYNDEHPLYFANVSIKVDSITSAGGITIRKIVASIDKIPSTSIYHITYEDWPDNGIPKSYQSVRSIIDYINIHKSTGPIIVHCSAGIGRTGAFVLMHSIVDQILSNNVSDDLTVAKQLVKLRTYRKGLVQTDVQYRFVLAWLKWYILSINKSLDNYLAKSTNYE